MRSSHPTKRTFPCPTFIVHRNKEVNVVEKKKDVELSHTKKYLKTGFRTE